MKIRISIAFKDEDILITYSDSGSVFEIKEENNSLGLFIVESMVTQLEGKLIRKGSEFRILLKHKN